VPTCPYQPLPDVFSPLLSSISLGSTAILTSILRGQPPGREKLSANLSRRSSFFLIVSSSRIPILITPAQRRLSHFFPFILLSPLSLRYLHFDPPGTVSSFPFSGSTNFSRRPDFFCSPPLFRSQFFFTPCSSERLRRRVLFRFAG